MEFTDRLWGSWRLDALYQRLHSKTLNWKLEFQGHTISLIIVLSRSVQAGIRNPLLTLRSEHAFCIFSRRQPYMSVIAYSWPIPSCLPHKGSQKDPEPLGCFQLCSTVTGTHGQSSQRSRETPCCPPEMAEVLNSILGKLNQVQPRFAGYCPFLAFPFLFQSRLFD